VNAKEHAAKVRYLTQENRRYSEVLEELPKSEWPPSWAALKASPVRILRSRRYLAQVHAPANGATRLTVCHAMIDREGNWLQDFSWEELMEIKGQCGFADCWAVEIFPDENEVVNVANMRHLWIVETAPAFAWRQA
jgi:hypothetical protein